MSGFKNELSPDLLDFWAGEIVKDYPELTVHSIAGIIMEGIKGRLEMKPNYGIGLSTIYSWIEETLHPDPRKGKNKYTSPIAGTIYLTAEEYEAHPNKSIFKLVSNG